MSVIDPKVAKVFALLSHDSGFHSNVWCLVEVLSLRYEPSLALDRAMCCKNERRLLRNPKSRRQEHLGRASVTTTYHILKPLRVSADTA